jgi:Ca2+-binding EF-hand superfamily protein
MGNFESRKGVAGAPDPEPVHVELNATEIRLLMSNSELSRDDVLAWHKQFEKTFPRGYVTREQFVEIYQKLFTHGRPEKFAEFAFNAFDQDHNGKLTLKEFIISTGFLTRLGSKYEENTKRLELAFDIFDVNFKDLNLNQNIFSVIIKVNFFFWKINHDGRISRNELLKLYEAIRKLQTREGRVNCAKEHVDSLLKKYDTDGDGTLNKAEFVKALHEENILRIFD